MRQKQKSVLKKRSTRTVSSKFEKGDLVTFSDSCPVDYRDPFKDGPIKIMEVEPEHPLPYGILMSVHYRASDLKLVRRRIK